MRIFGCEFEKYCELKMVQGTHYKYDPIVYNAILGNTHIGDSLVRTQKMFEQTLYVQKISSRGKRCWELLMGVDCRWGRVAGFGLCGDQNDGGNNIFAGTM